MSEQLIKCQANWVVKAAGKRFRPGETCALTKEQVSSLGNAVTVLEAEPAPASPDKPDPEVQTTQIALLVELIASLDKENESLWAKGGEPKVSVLQDLVDFDVTAQMRDEAWALVLEQAE